MNSIPGFRQHTLRVPLPSGGGMQGPEALVTERLRHADFARRIGDVLPAPLKQDFELLRLNILSGLHIRAVFRLEEDGRTPAGFVDDNFGPSWWQAANSVAGLSFAVGVELCSYLCENDGRLFVHLTPSAGDDKSSQKSRSKLSGHTDASALPLPEEQCGYEDIAPSPDLVILACIRNPKATETRIAPLSVIYRGLDAETTSTLKLPLFDFKPQASFSMAAGYVNSAKPVLVDNQNDGLRIRFSHSNVFPRSDEAAKALDALKAAIARAFEGIVLEPGDVLFVNNRTALHGRSEVGIAPNHLPRWLLRTYGMYARRPSYAVDGRRPYVLMPQGDGPTKATEA